MTCYHPMYGWRNRNDDDKRYKNLSSQPFTEEYKKIHYEKEFTEIPCGKCIGCRLEYSKMWAMRCMLEAKDHEFNEFITLTYDEEHVPRNKGVIDFDTGEIGETKTLNFKDLQDFMKRLRTNMKRRYGISNIRFYACGEYGEKRERPHYHIIAFNLPLFDKKIAQVSDKGSIQYESQFLTETWGKGLVRTSPVNFETCAYVARYVMKKVKGREAIELFEDTGRTIENVRMSRNPGIGKKYFDEHKNKIYQCDEIWLNNKYGPIKLKPPRYYDALYDIEEPEKMGQIKQTRKKNAETKEKSRLIETKKPKLEYLEEKEKFKQNQIKRLKRQLI